VWILTIVTTNIFKKDHKVENCGRDLESRKVKLDLLEHTKAKTEIPCSVGGSRDRLGTVKGGWQIRCQRGKSGRMRICDCKIKYTENQITKSYEVKIGDDALSDEIVATKSQN
jgi:hypothetical protein